MALTTKQEKVFRYVAELIEHRNISPSIRDIAAGIGSSSINGVHGMVQALIAKGLLARDSDGLLVLGYAAEQLPATTSLPLLGYISAGLPMEESEGAEHIERGKVYLGSQRREKKWFHYCPVNNRINSAVYHFHGYQLASAHL